MRIPDYNEPEPDLCVVRGESDDYTDHHPGPADIALIVEVADSSLATGPRREARQLCPGRHPCLLDRQPGRPPARGKFLPDRSTHTLPPRSSERPPPPIWSLPAKSSARSPWRTSFPNGPEPSPVLQGRSRQVGLKTFADARSRRFLATYSRPGETGGSRCLWAYLRTSP